MFRSSSLRVRVCRRALMHVSAHVCLVVPLKLWLVWFVLPIYVNHFSIHMRDWEHESQLISLVLRGQKNISKHRETLQITVNGNHNPSYSSITILEIPVEASYLCDKRCYNRFWLTTLTYPCSIRNYVSQLIELDFNGIVWIPVPFEWMSSGLSMISSRFFQRHW